MGTGRGWQKDVLTQKWSPATRPLLRDASENGPRRAWAPWAHNFSDHYFVFLFLLYLNHISLNPVAP